MIDIVFWRRGGRLWVLGLTLLVLRLWQNRTGFDPETGLPAPGFPGTALVVCLLLFAVLEAVRALRLPSEKAAYADRFLPPDKCLPAAVTGCLLLASGGVVLTLVSLADKDAASVVAGVLGAAAGAGLLFLLRQARAGGALTGVPVLPAMFFGVFLVLSTYLPRESDPVLARVYLPVLAAAMTTYAFSQLGGFLHKEGSTRAFLFTADLAVPLCLAAAADGGLALRLLFAGCALTLTVFLLLLRDIPSAGGRRVSRSQDQSPS